MDSSQDDKVVKLDSRQQRQLLRDSLSILEETKDNFNDLVTNPSDWKAMRLIAQRMNGFQGSFGFLEDEDYKFNIRELAELVELITDHYETKAIPIGEIELAVAKEALGFLIDVLANLKEKTPLTHELLNDIAMVLMKGTDLDFEEKEKLDQGNIDSLLEDLLGG